MYMWLYDIKAGLFKRKKYWEKPIKKHSHMKERTTINKGI